MVPKKLVSIGLASSIALVGCGKKDEAATAVKNLVGKFSVSSAVALDMVRGVVSNEGMRTAVGGLAGLNLEVDASSLHLTCFDTAVSPTIVMSGTIAADGSFSVNLAPAGSDPVNCDVKDASDKVVASLVFTGTGSAMGGGTRTFDTFALTSNTNLGSVTLNTVSGEATANGSLVDGGGAVAAAAAYDFTGTWTIGTLAAADVPSGYKNICSAAEGAADEAARQSDPNHVRLCDGPVAGMDIYLKRLVGKAFTPDATCTTAVQNHTFSPSSSCGGTVGAADEYGVMIWQSAAAFASCGSRLGFKYEEAKAFGAIDLSSSGVTEGAPQWSSTFNGHPLTEGWKLGDATAQWDVPDGGPYSENGQSMWIQWDILGDHYNLGLQNGGCTLDSSGANYQPDWQNVNNAGWSCSDGSTVTVGARSLHSNTCHNSDSHGAFTCTNTGGVYLAASAHVAAQSDAQYNSPFTPHNVITSGQRCDLIPLTSPRERLASLQCYVNAFYGNNGPGNGDGDGGSCLRELRTDWTATTPERFIVDDGPARAKSQFVLEKASYNSPTAVSFRQVEHDFRGVQSHGAWIGCDVQNVTTISFAKQAGDVLRVKFVTNTILNDTKDACVAAKSDLQIGTSFKVFTLTKH